MMSRSTSCWYEKRRSRVRQVCCLTFSKARGKDDRAVRTSFDIVTLPPTSPKSNLDLSLASRFLLPA